MSELTPGQVPEIAPAAPGEEAPEAPKPVARRRTRRAPGTTSSRPPRKPAAAPEAAPSLEPASAPALSVVTPPPPPSEGPRGRRSVSRTPVLVHPADIPDDADGRIEFITSDGSEVPAEPLEDTHRTPVAAIMPSPSSWLAVAVVGAVLVAVFVIGMALTR